jgi:hypothetical protein
MGLWPTKYSNFTHYYCPDWKFTRNYRKGRRPSVVQSNRNSNYHNSNCVMHFTMRDNLKVLRAKAMLIWRTLCVVLFYLQVISHIKWSKERKYKKSDWQVRHFGRGTIHLALDRATTYILLWYDIITQVEKKMGLSGRGVWNLFSAAQPQITWTAVLIRATVHGFSRFLPPSARRRRIVFCFLFVLFFIPGKFPWWNEIIVTRNWLFVSFVLPINEWVGKSFFNFPADLLECWFYQ